MSYDSWEDLFEDILLGGADVGYHTGNPDEQRDFIVPEKVGKRIDGNQEWRDIRELSTPEAYALGVAETRARQEAEE